MTHKNLSHLTEQQIKELINRYYNNEKVADLLKEFDINSSANVLVSLFPPIIHSCYALSSISNHIMQFLKTPV